MRPRRLAAGLTILVGFGLACGIGPPRPPPLPPPGQNEFGSDTDPTIEPEGPTEPTPTPIFLAGWMACEPASATIVHGESVRFTIVPAGPAIEPDRWRLLYDPDPARETSQVQPYPADDSAEWHFYRNGRGFDFTSTQVHPTDEVSQYIFGLEVQSTATDRQGFVLAIYEGIVQCTVNVRHLQSAAVPTLIPSPPPAPPVIVTPPSDLPLPPVQITLTPTLPATPTATQQAGAPSLSARIEGDTLYVNGSGFPPGAATKTVYDPSGGIAYQVSITIGADGQLAADFFAGASGAWTVKVVDAAGRETAASAVKP